MRSHAGDVSFPGGRQDEGEDNWTTALREANEEIGLPYHFSEAGGVLQRICEFPPYLSKNNLLVTPCVAYSPVDPYEWGWNPTKSEAEVEEIFAIRLSSIRDGESYDGRWMTWYNLSWRMHQFELPGLPYPFSTEKPKRIWGLTARMLVDITRTAFDQSPSYEFVDELGDQSRILKALEEGTFGKMGVREKERAETTGEGQIQGETDTQDRAEGKGAEGEEQVARYAFRGRSSGTLSILKRLCMLYVIFAQLSVLSTLSSYSYVSQLSRHLFPRRLSAALVELRTTDPKCFAFGLMLLLLLLYRSYPVASQEDSLLVMRSLGVQTTSRGTSRFIPKDEIEDIVIHEGFRGFAVHFYLAVITTRPGHDRIEVVFPDTLPRRRELEPVYRDARRVLFDTPP